MSSENFQFTDGDLSLLEIFKHTYVNFKTYLTELIKIPKRITSLKHLLLSRTKFSYSTSKGEIFP